MTLKIILFTTFLFSLNVRAEEQLNFFINTTPLTIYKYEDSRVSSSFKCAKLNRGEFCNELSFLKELKSYKIKTQIIGGASVGSIVCNEKLDGIIVMAKTSIGGENAFCKMKNGIYVELGTLGYYLNN